MLLDRICYLFVIKNGKKHKVNYSIHKVITVRRDVNKLIGIDVGHDYITSVDPNPRLYQVSRGIKSFEV